MNFSPTIDIVVPCYNVSHIVKDCVTSLLMQTYSENTITIFLINDGSSDGTDKIINSFSIHQNIIIINHHNNRGLSAARNSGIKAGDGEIIFSARIIKKCSALLKYQSDVLGFWFELFLNVYGDPWRCVI